MDMLDPLNPLVVQILQRGIGQILDHNALEEIGQNVIDYPDGWTSNRVVLSLLVGQITLAAVASLANEDTVSTVCGNLAQIAVSGPLAGP